MSTHHLLELLVRSLAGLALSLAGFDLSIAGVDYILI
jgi:hypothetical protein